MLNIENGFYVLKPECLRDRARRLGIPLSQLARDVGVDPTTPYKWFRTGRYDLEKVRLLSEELTRRELDMLAYLQDLHPAPVVVPAARLKRRFTELR